MSSMTIRKEDLPDGARLIVWDDNTVWILPDPDTGKGHCPLREWVREFRSNSQVSST